MGLVWLSCFESWCEHLGACLFFVTMEGFSKTSEKDGQVSLCFFQGWAAARGGPAEDQRCPGFCAFSLFLRLGASISFGQVVSRCWCQNLEGNWPLSVCDWRAQNHCGWPMGASASTTWRFWHLGHKLGRLQPWMEKSLLYSCLGWFSHNERWTHSLFRSGFTLLEIVELQGWNKVSHFLREIWRKQQYDHLSSSNRHWTWRPWLAWIFFRANSFGQRVGYGRWHFFEVGNWWHAESPYVRSLGPDGRKVGCPICGTTRGALGVWAWLLLMMCCCGGFCGVEAVVNFPLCHRFLESAHLFTSLYNAWGLWGVCLLLLWVQLRKRFLLQCVAGMSSEGATAIPVVWEWLCLDTVLCSWQVT